MEHQLPAGPQQPGGLGYPAGRVAPQAGAAFGDGQVEAARGQRDICGVSLDEGEGDAEPVLAAPGGLELGRGHVHPGRTGAAAGQPGGEVRRAAAELDGIQAADFTEHAELLLGHVEDAPGDVGGGPGAQGVLIGVFTVPLGPQLPVGGNFIRPGSSLSHLASPCFPEICPCHDKGRNPPGASRWVICSKIRHARDPPFGSGGVGSEMIVSAAQNWESGE